MKLSNDPNFQIDEDSLHMNNIDQNKIEEDVIPDSKAVSDYNVNNQEVQRKSLSLKEDEKMRINSVGVYKVKREEYKNNMHPRNVQQKNINQMYKQYKNINTKVYDENIEYHRKNYEENLYGSTKYDRIEELENYININNVTSVCSLRIKLWEALLLYVNNLNVEFIYFIISCLKEIEVYWGQEATENLHEIINLINDKKYKEVSNKIRETLSSLSVTTGKITDENPFFYTLIVSSKRDENRSNSTNNYSDLTCELNKILQYEHNRLSNQINNKTLEYKIIEVSNAREALLACLINPQILSVVIVEI